jgi:ferric-dicitrate binding protein FerR (iron transport regulator)
MTARRKWFRSAPREFAWFARLRSGSVSPRTRVRFDKWFASDAMNRRRHENVNALWDLSSAVGKDPLIQEALRDADRLVAEAGRRTRAIRFWSPARKTTLRMAGAIAGIAVVTTSVWIWTIHR